MPPPANLAPPVISAVTRVQEALRKYSTGGSLSLDDLLAVFPPLRDYEKVPNPGKKPEFLNEMAKVKKAFDEAEGYAAVLRRYRAGDIVCEEGEFGSTAFYIVSGHVEIYIANPLAHVRTKPRGLLAFVKRMSSSLVRRAEEDQTTAQRGFIPIDASVDLPRTMPLAYLGAGELFGEMTCRTFQPRSATVRASEDCIMVEMLRVVLDLLVGTRDPDAQTKALTKVRSATFRGTSFKKQMDDQYRERSLVAHLRSVPLFATIDLEFSNYLRDHAELISCNKGQVICKQGDAADAFYLIRTGLVRVAQAMPGGEMVRTYLKRGEYFGEIGLIMDQARNATCSALDAVDLVKIGKGDFQLMLERFPIVRATLLQVAIARAEANKERKMPAGLQLDEFLNQGLFEAQNLLLIDLDHCTRCDACVNACADAHEGVTRLIRDGLRYDRYLVATACRSCRDPLCMTQCPVGSIRRKESLEIIIEDWCIGCSKCAELCPYGNINMHSFEVTKEVPATEAKPAAKPAAAAAKPATPAAKPASGAPVKASASREASPDVFAKIASAPSKQGELNAPAPAAPVSDSISPAPEVARGDKGEAPVAKHVEAADAPAAARAEIIAAVSGEATAAAGKPSSTGEASPAISPASAPSPELVAIPSGASQGGEKTSPAAAVKSAAPVEKAPVKAAPTPAATAVKPTAPAKPAAPKKLVRKKVTVSKATTCDLCTQLSVPSCVYACPHEAAMRVDPTKFLASHIGGNKKAKRRFQWLLRRTEDRTTH